MEEVAEQNSGIANDSLPNDDHKSYPVAIASLTELREYRIIEEASDTHITDVINLAEYRLSKNELPLIYKSDGKISPSCHVGAFWLDMPKRIPLIINPKFDDTDYLTMLTTVLAKTQSLCELFKFKLDQPSIEIDQSKEDLFLIQLLVYIKRLNEFCRRDLKKGFIREEENLVGKVKGKILINDNIIKNSFRGRADRVFCQYQSFSIDNLDNQILKRALWVTKRKLKEVSVNRNIKDDLWKWVRQCEAAMDQVSLVEIKPRDLVNKAYSGFNRRYEDIHKLAKMILMNFRIDSEVKFERRDTTYVIPFSINMNMLFEKYVEFYLESIGLTKIVAPKKEEAFNLVNSSEINIRIKPDYLGKKIVKRGNSNYGVIIDAKYKELFEATIQDNAQDDSIELSPEPSRLKTEALDWVKKIPNSEIYQLISYLMFYRSRKTDFFEDIEKASIRYGVLVFPSDNITDEAMKCDGFWDAFIEAPPEHYPTLRIPIVANGQIDENDIITIKILPCPLPVK